MASPSFRGFGHDRGDGLMTRFASVPAFFLFRVALGLLLLKLSTSHLPVEGFTSFSQFMLFAALLNLVAVGGAQNGLIRQAAAALDLDALSRVHGAALYIWRSVAPPLVLLIAMGSGWISDVLVGTPDRWWVVIAITLIAFIAGPGQVWCSILSGRKQVGASLLAQGIGLLAGTLLASWLIAADQPFGATIGFAGGSLVTMGIAFHFASRLGMRKVARTVARGEVPALLGYSSAFAATTIFSAILLFGLRSHYRAQLGTSALGYWMAANRISDMSTQLLGLFLIQFFVPHFAMLHTNAERRALALWSWLAGVAVMGAIPLVFSLLARPLVHLFLSDAYLAAIPAIRAYMFGDLLRVWASLAMYAAFARGHPGRYAGIEIATLSVMGIVTLAMIGTGNPRAPFIGYCAAYATTAIIITLVFLWRSRSVMITGSSTTSEVATHGR
jgi:O-antigen/teichoic acid export membrane protein